MRRVYSVINIRDADLKKVLKYLEQYRYVKGWDNAPSRDYLHYLCLNETACKYNWTSATDSIDIFMKGNLIYNYSSFLEYVKKQRYVI